MLKGISHTVWDLKYRYRLHDQVQDHTIMDTWQRVARAIAFAEKPAERLIWQQKFYRILENFKFLPGGRILAGAGTQHQVTLFNCFVMQINQDSLPAIFKALGEGAKTLHQGGGVGYDFSLLRPEGARVKKIDIPASGPVSFMRIWDVMCSVLLSTGARRGAMMGVLRCDHPDIEAFIDAKKNPQALRHFNVSVMVSDDFMQAVQEDADWALIFPVANHTAAKGQVIHRVWNQGVVPCQVYGYVKARALWEKIIRSAYDCAEPGVLFGDTINRLNNLYYRERILATNPCGEIPLPPYGACDLGAINLTQFVSAPFTAKAQLNWPELEETVHLATRFLDNVIDISRYPLKAQEKAARGTRRIGLGLTGLADTFVMLGLRYGSQASLDCASEIMRRIAQVTWQTSIALAKEKGSFPYFTKKYLKGEFVQHLPADIQNNLSAGVRNSHHNTIAPAGTISLLANNISNGIEPIFRYQYQRHMRMIDHTATFLVTDYAYQLWQQTKTAQEQFPPAWFDTDTLTPEDHLAVQGVMQPFIDHAISKTINIPRDYPFAKLNDIYSKAYALQLKGCTIFRPNEISGSIMDIPEEHCCQFEEEG